MRGTKNSLFCKHGHVCFVRTSSGQCAVCRRADRAKQFQRRKKDPEYRKVRRERRLRAARLKGVPARQPPLSHHEKRLRRGLRRKVDKLRKRAVPGSIKWEMLVSIHRMQLGECRWCPKRLTVGTPDCTIDHVMPIAKGGTNDRDNIALACHRCNSIKRDQHPDQWIASLYPPRS